MELGILSLSDLQISIDTGQPITAAQRIADTIDYAVLADQLGLDAFALGEHHTLDFAVSSPAVVLAAIAARTQRIRLTSAVTVLSALDPVRVYQDFATLDLISNGRAEIIAGRSAFTEPFALFGKLPREHWRTWPEAEQDAIDGYLDAEGSQMSTVTGAEFAHPEIGGAGHRRVARCSACHPTDSPSCVPPIRSGPSVCCYVR